MTEWSILPDFFMNFSTMAFFFWYFLSCTARLAGTRYKQLLIDQKYTILLFLPTGAERIAKARSF
jgi:hypothetical protein